jgi:hypothetical protein
VVAVSLVNLNSGAPVMRGGGWAPRKVWSKMAEHTRKYIIEI